MPRRRTNEQTPPAAREPRKRGRRKVEQPAQPVDAGRDDIGPESVGVEAPPAPAQDPALAEAEQALIEKYPNRNVVPGSLRPGAAEGWGGKRIVTIRCSNCNQPRDVATSDLFHVAHCAGCAKANKKAARKAKKESEG